MKYDFDRIYDRAGTDSLKWKKGLFGAEDILPLWVADMDFPVAEPIVQALRERLEHPIFGYGYVSESVTGAIVERLERKWGWRVEPEWIVFSPGVVPLLTAAVRALVPQGTRVAIQTPGYPRFFPAITSSGCAVAVSQHKLVGDHYEMDFADLEAKFADPDVGAFMLCSPQNPIGRVWRHEELMKVGELAARHGKPVISDEMHAEIIMPGFNHIPFASLSPELASRSIVCMSISKTFNLAGLATSFAVIPDEAMRAGIRRATDSITGDVNILGLVALEAAFRHGDEWLAQALAYIEGNFRFLKEYLTARIPSIKVLPLEGTYLAWLDCRELGLDVKALDRFFLEQARVAPMGGGVFGPGSEGFQRLNLACPRPILAEALQRIERAVNSLR